MKTQTSKFLELSKKINKIAKLKHHKIEMFTTLSNKKRITVLLLDEKGMIVNAYMFRNESKKNIENKFNEILDTIL